MDASAAVVVHDNTNSTRTARHGVLQRGWLMFRVANQRCSAHMGDFADSCELESHLTLPAKFLLARSSCA